MRQRNNFAAQGFNIVMMDVPSDHSTGYPLTATNSFRRSANHQTDIAYVIDYARTTFGLPVWLVGNQPRLHLGGKRRADRRAAAHAGRS